MIQLQSLTIENFRGIREGRIDGLTAVNLLVGRNNSGKTTVLESITRLATRAGLQQDVLGRDVDGFWQEVRQLPADQELMWHRLDTANDIAITGTISETRLPGSDGELSYRQSMNQGHGNGLTRMQRPRVRSSCE